MSTISLLMLLLFATTLGTAPVQEPSDVFYASDQRDCPPDEMIARVTINWLLVAPQLENIRIDLNVTTRTMADLQPITDAEVCARLGSLAIELDTWPFADITRWYFYQLDQYFVIVRSFWPGKSDDWRPHVDPSPFYLFIIDPASYEIVHGGSLRGLGESSRER